MASRVSDNEWVIQSTSASRRLPLGIGRLADERLAQLVAAGRERAFAVLYERYHQPLYRYCRSMLRNDQDAQDALQSTFASALAALQAGRRNAPFRPWLFRIAHNEAITVIRRRRDSWHEVSDSLLAPAASASAAEEADDRARVALLMADLAELPERQRAALLMRELNGLSHAEISIALATSVTAAKQAIFDARTALTEFVEGRALACEDVRHKISERDGRVLRSRRMRSHLRDCPSCASFAAAITERRSDLQAIAPLLPAAASAAVLARLGGSAPGYGGAGGVGAAGKLGTTAIASKAAVGATVVVTAAAGLGALPLHSHSTRPSAHATPGRAAAPSKASVAGGHRATVAAPAALSHPTSRPPAAAAPRARPRHTPAAVKHAAAGTQGPSPVPLAVTPSQPVVSPVPSTHGKSALPHGKRGLSHGKSGLSHGKSAQAPGHTKVSEVASGSAAAPKTKPAHIPPGQSGTAGKSASSPGHLKSAKTDPNAAPE
jgi:RNA polymerase sigma factor (sigma-70 family)